MALAKQLDPRAASGFGAAAQAFVIGLSIALAAVTSSAYLPGAALIIGLSIACVILVVRPPLEWTLPLIPLSIPLGNVAFIHIGESQAPLAYADLAIVVVALSWCARPRSVDRTALRVSCALLGWSLVSVVASDRITAGVFGFKVIVESTAVFLIASSTPASRAPTVYKNTAVATAVMGALVGFSLFVTGAGASTELVRAALSNKFLGYSDLSWGRSNYLAAFIVLGLFTALAVYPRVSRATKLLLMGCALPMAYGLVVTASKSQLLSIVLIFLVAVIGVDIVRSIRKGFSLRPLARSAVLLATGVFLLSIVGGNYIAPIFEPLTETGVSGFATVVNRQEIWSISLNDVVHNPLTGVGMQGITLHDGTFTQAHNTVLQVAAESGIIGLVLFCWLFVLPFLNQRGWRRDAILIFATLVIGGLAENTLRTGVFDYVAWALLGSLMALRWMDDTPRLDKTLSSANAGGRREPR